MISVDKDEIMRMLRWTCCESLRGKVSSVEQMVTEFVQRNQLSWLGHVLWKDDGDWVKRSMFYEVGSMTGRRPRMTWNQLVEIDVRVQVE